MSEPADRPLPPLSLTEWEPAKITLHLWTQIVGKIKLALNPMINHWWQVPLYVSARGLTTSLMPAGDQGLEIEFDFVDHSLHLRTTDGSLRAVVLDLPHAWTPWKRRWRTFDAARGCDRPIYGSSVVPFGDVSDRTRSSTRSVRGVRRRTAGRCSSGKTSEGTRRSAVSPVTDTSRAVI